MTDMKVPVARSTCALIIAACVLAQPGTARAADDAPGAWLTGSVTGRLGDSDDSQWHYQVDAQARYFDLGTGTNQWLVRPAIGYALNDRSRVWVGYARYRSRNSAGIVADEDRYWQQVDWKAGQFGGGDWSLRLRLEQRDISTARDTRHVGRLMARYMRPLAGDSPRTLVLSVEPFFDLNTTDWGGDTGLSQYRLYGGLAWGLSPTTTLETGYMQQHIEVESGIDRTNHLAIIGFKMRFK